MNAEDEFPSIGDRRQGQVLVCMGDDRPDQWDSWLEALVGDFEALEKTATEHGLVLCTGSEHGELEGWADFCEALGISVSSDFWEGSKGSMINGHFVMGWIKLGGVRSAKKTGKEIIKQLEKGLLEQLRRKRVDELGRVKDLYILIERTRDDRAALLSETAKLKTDLEAAYKMTSTLREAFAKAKEDDTSELTLDCLRIASAVLNGDRKILVAGPLVLWSDGVVYGLTSRGAVPVPPDSAPAILIKELQRAGHAVVEVGEGTMVRGFLNPRLVTGSPHISGWTNIWGKNESCERTFLVANPDQLAVVCQIHEHFKTPARA